MTGVDTASLFHPWEKEPAILIAVSGGPDSLALLHLSAQWAKAPGRPRLYAATVDHGLRPEAATEAKLAARAAEALNIPHQILHWQGAKPARAIQEKAREARYELLAACAKKIGAGVIMTAHHRDDQAETILFRLLRGSGLSGLSGMKAEADRSGLRIARPLLTLSKVQLVEICREAGQDFAEDPSNANTLYARTRLRGLLARLEEHDIGAPDWSRLGHRLARADAALGERARAVQEHVALPNGKGQPAIAYGRLQEEPEEIRLRVLALAMEKAGARLPLPLEKLESQLEKLQTSFETGRSCAGTLAGLKWKLDNKFLLSFTKEGPRRRGLSN